MISPVSGQLKDRAAASMGTHCILELYECPFGLLNDVTMMNNVLATAAQKAGSTLLNQVLHQFDPQGITALALLAESHISIHTWPETGYAAVDVFTCGQHTDPEQACLYLIHALQAGSHSMQILSRNPHCRSPQLV